MRTMVRVGWVLCISALINVGRACAQTDVPAATPAVSGESDPVLERVLRQWPEGRIDTLAEPTEWSYEEGVLLDGVVAQWKQTGEGRLFAYAKAAVDRAVDADGRITVGGAAFPVEAHSLDDVEMGRSVLAMYRVTQGERYYQAAKFLHDQMQKQPKNVNGGYWHEGIYPNQMWLDGAYTAEPFLENYGKMFAHQDDMDGVAEQLLLMYAKMRDRQTGLLRHGWDASAQMEWANKKNGLSPEVWSRAMGWYAMAAVDVLERMPATDPQRAALEAATRQALQSVVRYQDPESGLWWQVMDKGGQKGNFLEASASCMFVYALAKGVRLGLLGLPAEETVTRGWDGIQKRFVKADGTFAGTVKLGGLGGTPYRSGTFEYYVGEPVVENDAKGVGAYLLALSEMTQRKRAGELLRKARGKTVLLDAWFNSQTRKTAGGNVELYHYKWNDETEGGYSMWAKMFQQYGLRTDTLDHAPRAEDLKGVAVYVIASPDNLKSNPQAHMMDEDSAEAVDAWVRAGGVLVMMQNDDQHADQDHFDMLSIRFGMHFNSVLRNEELDNDYANTIVIIPAGTGGIFHHAHKAVMTETCTITASAPSKAVLTDKGATFMAGAHVGKGVVYGNVDPWLYNEYTDGRKLPLGEDNFAAGQELTRWIVAEATR